MKIAIMAAGAVGGYFGARLADAGHEVTFIARGKHLDAIRKDGLRIKSDLGDLHLKDISATDDPRAVGPVDVIIFAVKLWDTISSIEACKPMLSKDTVVISLLNGVSASAQISESLGPQHNLPGSAYISSVISEIGRAHV